MTKVTRHWIFHVPVRIVWGTGVASEVGAEARHLGATRVMIVTDPGVLRAGIAATIAETLGQAGITVTLFDRVECNPGAQTVAAGVAALLAADAEALVAVGGGSVMDAAKAISLLAGNGGDLLRYAESGRSDVKAGPPVITIPTIAGSGSEVTSWVVITHGTRKLSIGSIHMAPRAALIDPMLTVGVSPYLSAVGGVDALAHALEAYMAPGARAPTDALALSAVELLSASLPVAVRDGQNCDARDAVMMASTMAGLAFPGAGLGMTHALAHPLGGHFGMAHGVAVAVLLPHVLEHQWQAHIPRFARMAQALGIADQGLSQEDLAARVAPAVRNLVTDIGLATNLHVLGIRPDHLPILAHDAVSDRLLWPSEADAAEATSIFRDALRA